MDGPLEILWEPLDAPGIEEKAEAVTWSRLEVRVRTADGRLLAPTRLLDVRAKAQRDGAYGTVLPLAEWMVRSWSHLFESRRERPCGPAEDAERYEWDRVHRIRYSGDGAALPDLALTAPESGRIALEWRSDLDGDDLNADFSPVRFVTHGAVELPAAAVELECARFIDSILERLRQLAPDDIRTARLADDWSVQRDPRHPEFRAQKYGALLGVLWWDTSPQERKRLVSLADRPLNPVLLGCLEAAQMRTLRSFEDFADTTWKECERTTKNSGGWAELWKRLHRTVHQRDEEPWQTGWIAAKSYRSAIGLPHDAALPRTIIDKSLVSVSRAAPPAGIDAVVAWRGGHKPIRIRQHGGPMTERFAQARDLYSLLFGPGPAGDHAFVFSRRIAGRSSVANAFAAELLSPVALLKAHIETHVVGLEEIETLARQIRAPLPCVLHQLRNHGVAAVGDLL